MLNPDIRKRLCDAIRAGSTIELACKYAGLGFRTYYNGLSRAKSGDPEWSEVLADLALAEGQGAIQLLAVIRSAASSGNWQAAAWILERRYPKMYGRSESRFAPEPEEAPKPYDTREELLAALATLPPDVLRESLSRRAPE